MSEVVEPLLSQEVAVSKGRPDRVRLLSAESISCVTVFIICFTFMMTSLLYLKLPSSHSLSQADREGGWTRTMYGEYKLLTTSCQVATIFI